MLKKENYGDDHYPDAGDNFKMDSMMMTPFAGPYNLHLFSHSSLCRAKHTQFLLNIHKFYLLRAKNTGA